MSPGSGPSQPVRDVVGYTLGYLQALPHGTTRDASVLPAIVARAERELGIDADTVQAGAELALQYYLGAARARQYLAAGGPRFTRHIDPQLRSFLPQGQAVPEAMGIRVYFERQIANGAWVQTSVVVNVASGTGIRAATDAAVAAVLRGDVRTGHASPQGGATRNATIIGIAGYERNDAVTIFLPQ